MHPKRICSSERFCPRQHARSNSLQIGHDCQKIGPHLPDCFIRENGCVDRKAHGAMIFAGSQESRVPLQHIRVF